ncbi:aminotransferase class IV [Acetobacterium fimetarium]|uniref:aminotransferase class IV n=1 Tax=Acetobacterium fimetarium TaxID=52691 RepID=UPI00164CD2B8|nr:aminotransferase class IV [Acetobacterium fimetarium]
MSIIQYVCYNGEITEECLVPLDQGLLYGYGVFETINVSSGKLVFFQEHMERLKSSAALLGLEFGQTSEQLMVDCEKLIEKNQIDKGGLRVTLSKSEKKNAIIITARENHYGDEVFKQGVSIGVSDYARNEQSLLVAIKSNNYLENLLILNDSKKRGFNEAVFFNTKGYLAEGTMSNIFLIRDQKVYTPAQDSGILPGIVRDKVITLLKKHKIPVAEGYYTRETLMNADEIFITNSLMEIMPVKQLENLKFQVTSESFTNYLKNLYKKEYDIV